MEALWAAIAPLVGGAGAVGGGEAAALESAVSDAIPGVAIARIAPTVLHPLREVVGDGAFLLAYAAHGAATGAGAGDDGGEQEPVAVVRMATAAPHGMMPGLAPLGGAATTAAPSDGAAATYLRAPTGLLPLATARSLLAAYSTKAAGLAAPVVPCFAVTHLPHDATAPQILGVQLAADVAGAKGQAPGAWITRSVDIALAGDIAKGATMETLFRHATGAAVPSSIRLRSDFVHTARYELAGSVGIRAGLVPCASVWLTTQWKGPLPESLPSVPPASATATLTVRLVPFERDPEAYLAVRPLRLELDALLRMHAAATATEASPLAGPGLANGAERLEALQTESAKADALAASLLMIGNLAPREDLDFVERLWLLAKEAATVEEVRALLVGVFDGLEAGTLKPMIHRSNACALATLIRDAVKLWRNPGAADFAEQREVITRACDHWHEHALECMVDAGLGKLERDYSHYLVGGEALDWSQLSEYLAETTAGVQRLAVLQRLVELWVFVRQAVLGMPLEWVRALLRSALDGFRRGLLSGTTTLEVALPLPKFASGTAGVLATITQTIDPMEWMLACPPAEPALEHMVVRLSRSADLVTLPLGQQAVGLDDGAEAGDGALGDDLLTIRRYAVAVGRADDQRWNRENERP